MQSKRPHELDCPICGKVCTQKQFKVIKPYEFWICQECRDQNGFLVRQGRPLLKPGDRKPAEPVAELAPEAQETELNAYDAYLAAGEYLNACRDAAERASADVTKCRDALTAAVDAATLAGRKLLDARRAYELAGRAYDASRGEEGQG